MIPDLLKKGDTVAIVAPAGAVKMDNVLWAKKYIENKGYSVVLGKFFSNQNNYFSGSKEERLQDLQWALNDNNIRAVFCARGGYGSVHLIDHISFNRFTKNPKWIVGFSDITVLLNHIYAKYKIPSIHGVMPNSFNTATPESLDSLFKILEFGSIEYSVLQHEYLQYSNIQAPIIGGNLSLIYSLMGSKSLPNSLNKILFIEDIAEYKYHIDRMLYSLKRSGYLSKLNGLIIGGFTGIKDTTAPFGKTVTEIIVESIQEYNIPVLRTFSAGHLQHNLPLIIGGNCEFKKDKIRMNC